MRPTMQEDGGYNMNGDDLLRLIGNVSERFGEQLKGRLWDNQEDD
jgi:hypothetical protein